MLIYFEIKNVNKNQLVDFSPNNPLSLMCIFRKISSKTLFFTDFTYPEPEIFESRITNVDSRIKSEFSNLNCALTNKLICELMLFS